MEATNISIKQQSGVSINVDVNVSINIAALKATVQHGLQTIKQHCNVGAWSLSRLYRQDLRLARAVARAIDARPAISNIALWLMGIAIMVEIFMFA